VSRKGKAGPLEAGRGKHSPPANPERVTSEALKRKDNGVLLEKPESIVVSIDYKNRPSKIQETPASRNGSPSSYLRTLLCHGDKSTLNNRVFFITKYVLHPIFYWGMLK
jgi:hypothetical protein